MSGWPRCASAAPSHSCTRACTIDCGCTTTSMRSYGVPKRQWASITSRPLFIRVAESIVIFPPMAQVGWRSACSTVTPSSSSRARPRNGPAGRREHELVDGARVLAGEQLVQRRVLGVHGHEPRAGGLRQRHDELAADHERLLVGERDVDPLGERHDRGPQAGRPDDGVQDQVGARLGDQAHQPLRAVQHLAVRPRLRRARRGVRVGQRDAPHAVLARLGDEGLVGALGGQADELERARGARHDVERLRADGARGAEDQQPLHRRAIVAAAFSAPARRAGGASRRSSVRPHAHAGSPPRRPGRGARPAGWRGGRRPAPRQPAPAQRRAPPVAPLRAARRRAGDRVRARRGLLPVGRARAAGTSTRSPPCSASTPATAARRWPTRRPPRPARSPTRPPGTPRTRARSSSRSGSPGSRPATSTACSSPRAARSPSSPR